MDTSTRYYICWYRLDGLDSYVIWYSNERDGVLTDQPLLVPSFPSMEQARSYAEQVGIQVEAEEPVLHNLDILSEWLRSPDNRTIRCDHFLSAWNLFSDIASSVEGAAFEQEERGVKAIYNKLFEGNNLPSWRAPGEIYIPGWSEREVAQMERVLGRGLSLFRAVVVRQEGEGTDDLR